MSMEEIKKDKRFKLITIIVAIPIIIGLGFGTYLQFQPEESVGWAESEFVQTQAQVNDSDLVKPSIPATTKSPEQIAAEAAKLVEQMKQAQQQQATMVNGKQVELINEPTPEPVVKVEPRPRYESKEAAAKNPPPPPKPKETAQPGQQPTNPVSSNSGGSNLVPDSQNPFKQPGAAATNVKEVRGEDISNHIPGTGDKF